MTTLAHLSDLHFGRHVQVVVDSLLSELERRQPDVIVISGDFTQRARRREFTAAAAFIERLPVKPVVIPGNHDLAAWDVVKRIAKPLARYRQYISRELEPFFENDEAAILGVNTTRRAGWYLDWSRGRISARQLEAICRRFNRTEGSKVKVLVTHHPFSQKPGESKERHLIDAPPGCLAALGGCGVELILSGHFHQGHAEVLSAPDGGEILAIQAGTAVSSRLKGEPNSFNWITLDPSADSRIQFEVVSLGTDSSWS